MKVILDMDQIICAFTEKVVQWWNQDHPDRISRSIKQITSWDIDRHLGTEYFLRSCMRCPELWRDLEEVEGAVAGTKELLERGHEVRIASAVPKSAAVAYHGKCQWLRDHMPFFDLDNFYAIHRKDELSGDLLFDDGAHNVEAWAATGRPVAMLDSPWNQGFEETKLVTRVKDWGEFMTFVKGFEAGGKR